MKYTNWQFGRHKFFRCKTTELCFRWSIQTFVYSAGAIHQKFEVEWKISIQFAAVKINACKYNATAYGSNARWSLWSTLRTKNAQHMQMCIARSLYCRLSVLDSIEYFIAICISCSLSFLILKSGGCESTRCFPLHLNSTSTAIKREKENACECKNV